MMPLGPQAVSDDKIGKSLKKWREDIFFDQRHTIQAFILTQFHRINQVQKMSWKQNCNKSGAPTNDKNTCIGGNACHQWKIVDGESLLNSSCQPVQDHNYLFVFVSFWISVRLSVSVRCYFLLYAWTAHALSKMTFDCI